MNYIALIVGMLGLALAGCGAIATAPAREPAEAATATPAASTAATPAASSTDEQRFPDILDAQLTRNADGSYSIAVTVSSPYDTPERYADGWRVLAPDDSVLGEHTLLHDHAGEQPFTRTQRGVRIPDGVQTVTVEGRDQQHGYGGTTLEVAVPEG